MEGETKGGSGGLQRQGGRDAVGGREEGREGGSEGGREEGREGGRVEMRK